MYVYFKEWVGMSGSFTGVTINTGRCTGITHEGGNQERDGGKRQELEEELRREFKRESKGGGNEIKELLRQTQTFYKLV